MPKLRQRAAPKLRQVQLMRRKILQALLREVNRRQEHRKNKLRQVNVLQRRMLMLRLNQRKQRWKVKQLRQPARETLRQVRKRHRTLQTACQQIT